MSVTHGNVRAASASVGDARAELNSFYDNPLGTLKLACAKLVNRLFATLVLSPLQLKIILAWDDICKINELRRNAR